jgi:SAM-dependent methyltransferase
MSSFTALANSAGSDKGTQIGTAHGYSILYDTLFAPLRHLPRVDILEMGLAIGGPELGGDINRKVSNSPSVNAWLQFFEKPEIVGFDISDFSTIRHDNFVFVRGDSGNRSDLEQLLELGRRFDVILDDASHASYHQQLALAMLFDALKPGGFYIIEDLSWQPSEMEDELPKVSRTAQLLSKLLVNGCLPTSAAINDAEARFIEREVSGIWLFDESYLNALGDSFNRRNGLPSIQRQGWRGDAALKRLVSPYFWLFSARRFVQGLSGTESVNWKSVKLAVLQKKLD